MTRSNCVLLEHLVINNKVSMNKYHLAQINVAHAHAPLESEIMAGFVDRLDEINALAENSHGFVWRHTSEESYAASMQASDNSLLLINMSIWQDLESLKNYVYKSIHVELIQDRSAWFKKMLTQHQALWWIPAGEIPSIEDGKAKLAFLQDNGPTQEAFTFAKPF